MMKTCPPEIFSAGRKTPYVNVLLTAPDWTMWCRLLNCLLDLGRVRPFILFEKPKTDLRPHITFSAPRLLWHLALQTCLVAVHQQGFAICSVCRKAYVP